MTSKIDKKGRECTRCRIYKKYSEFYKDKHTTTGHCHVCIPCTKTSKKEAYAKTEVNQGSIIVSTSKQAKCSQCLKTKPISEFRKRRADYGGGFYSVCKECTSAPFSNGSTPAMDVAVDVDFLLQIKRSAKNGWNLDQAKYLLVKIKDAFDRGSNDFTAIYTKYGSGKSKSGCIALLKEIKALAAANRELAEKGKPVVSLDDYWKQGRQLKPQNKILYKGKKNN